MPVPRVVVHLLGLLTVVGVALATVACGAFGQPGGARGSAGSQVVVVEAREFAFEPATLTVPAGEVTFSVKNTGTVEHEFELLDGDRVVDEVEGLVPGLNRDLTVTLEPGTYRYVCKLAGHEEAGMTGTLTVTG